MPQGSSSGGSNDSCKLELKAYAKEDAKLPQRHSGCTPVMVSIAAQSRMTKQRAPVDVVLVLHVHIRYMVPANWHDLLNQATKLIVGKLGENDRLAVVPALLKETRIIFEDAVIVPVKPKLLTMSSENKAAACNSVESSEAMRSNTTLVRDLESAEAILYGRESDDKEKRAGYIIVISNSNEDMSSVLSWRFRSVHAFGFRDAHNARTMYTIANSQESTYAILDEGGGITQEFIASVDKITSAVEPMEVKLKCNQEVVLCSISARRISHFVSYDKKVGIIWANTHSSGDPSNFIIYLDIPDYYGSKYGDLLKIQVKYGQPPNSVKLEGPPLATVRKGMNGSKEVAAEIVRIEAVKIIADITAEDKIDSEQLHATADALRERWSRLEDSVEAEEAGLVSWLAAKMQEMEAALRNDYLWREYMFSWRSHQWWPLQALTMGKQQALTMGKQQVTAKGPLLRLRILAKVDAIPAPIRKPQRGLPVLVHVMVPVEGIAEEKSVPLDVVAVLDVSSVVKELKIKRLQQLNKAMGLLMEKLSHKDRLAIISVQSATTEPSAGLLQMTEKGRRKYSEMLSIVTSAGKAAPQNSHWREQLKKCLAVNSSRTDFRGRSKLCKSLMDANELLDFRGADAKDRMGLIILISDSNETSIGHLTLRSSYSVHAFSFHGADNARAMHRIASISSGIYAMVDDGRDKITEAFVACISNITSLIAMNTKVNIECRYSSVKLSTIESGQFHSTIDHGKQSGSIFTGALYAGAEKRFIAYLENVPEEDYGNLSEILSVYVTWQHASNMVEEKLEGQVIIVRDENDGSMEVVEEILRIEEVKIISAITDPKTHKDSVVVKVQELHKGLKVEAADVCVRPKSSSYALALDEERLASLARDTDGSWLSYMLSWLSFQILCEKTPLARSRFATRREKL